VETYLAEVTDLSSRFIDLVGDALNLQPQRLHSYLSPQHRLKLVHYAGSTGTERDLQLQGVGPHKDSSGWWTFLLQASPPPIGGLQVLNRSNQWIDVPSIPGTFVVNIGQAFEAISGGLCPATIHRVLSGAEPRYSVPFFQGVRGDLTKQEFTDLWQDLRGKGVSTAEVAEGIDSAFLRGDINTWGEWQLKTKIKSHPDAGKRFYGEVFEKYTDSAQEFG
jgi:isopenicillin N synthase-like dioxygenase